jgi:F-box/leucine-rich repeat protein 14
LRLVCAAWQAVHDALVMRLALRPHTTDQAMGMLVRRFPTVVSLESKGNESRVLTDQGMRAVSRLASLTFLNLSWCRNVTDAGVRAVVSSCTALEYLNLYACNNITDKGMRAVSSLPALTTLNLSFCVTDKGILIRDSHDEPIFVRAVSSCTALTSLNLSSNYELTEKGMRAVSSCTSLKSLDLRECFKLTDEAVRALSSLPALTSLNLSHCYVTAAGVQALRSTTAAPSLHIESRW